MAASTAPLFLRDGQPIPEGIDPARVIFVVRVFIEPPVREESELPKSEPQASPASEKPQRRQQLEYPNLGIA
jgi:hypothetical protein